MTRKKPLTLMLLLCQSYTDCINMKGARATFWLYGLFIFENERRLVLVLVPEEVLF